MTTTMEPLLIAGTVTIDEGNKRPKERRASHRTYVLTAANPAWQIAGYDPARKCIYLNVMDNPIVLSESTSQANDAANLTAGLTTPNGRILDKSNGSEYLIETQDELWVSNGVYPTRVGVTVIREI